MSFVRRVVTFTVLLLVGFATTACFDREPEQRKAFIAFLQQRIIDKPGLHIPILSEQVFQDIGRTYADQYRIMSGFHQRVDASISTDLSRAMRLGAVRSLRELADQRALFPVVTGAMAKMAQDLDKAQAEADAAHAALKQPPDLKAVYDLAYVRMVTTPAQVFHELLPMLQVAIPKLEALAVYIDDHRDQIEFNGNMLSSKDAKVQEKLSELLQSALAASRAADDGKRKLQALAQGR